MLLVVGAMVALVLTMLGLVIVMIIVPEKGLLIFTAGALLLALVVILGTIGFTLLRVRSW